MKIKEFNMLYDRDIVTRVSGLVKETSKVKQLVFKAVLSNSEVDKVSIKFFISYVNDYLGFWESFANDMKEKIAKTTPRKTKSIGYQDVKDYIYAKYDYAAVLQFADGVIQLIADKSTITKAEDINDFFSHTISKAFDDQPNSVGGLVDSVLMSSKDETIRSGPADDNEVKMFNSVKSYANGHPGMFNSRDRVELFKAVSKTIEFITDHDMISKYLGGTDNKIFVAAINSIIDFATYSLVAYAARIFMINAYAYPYIYNDRSDTVEESTEIKLPSTGPDFDEVEISIIRNMDEAICKDIDRFEEFINAFDKFSTIIGGDDEYGNHKPKYSKRMYYQISNSDHNALSNSLIGNDLYNLVIRLDRDYSSYNMRDADVRELNTRLKGAVYNQLQGLQGTSSPKQEMLTMIRALKCDHTIKGCQVVFADLFMGAACILSNILNMIAELIIWNHDEIKDPRFTIDTRSTCQENLRILTELYSELAYVFIQKAREIETIYNSLNATAINRAINLDIPGGHSKEIGTTNDITNAIPDTARMPIELSNLYALPAFESYQFYDEMVKVKYGLENDLYFSEAFSISEIINKILAFIQGIGKELDTWFNDPKLKAALAYVNKNGNTLTSMKFANDKSMQVLPFRNNGTTENIDLKAIMDNLVKQLNAFDPAILDSPEKVTDFAKKLYPDQTVYNWFAEGDDKSAAKKFRNWVLYQPNAANVTDQDMKGQDIKGADIETHIKWWVDTCNGGQTMYKKLKEYEQQMIAAHNAIKGKVSTITASTKTQQVTDTDTGKEDGSQSQQQQQNDNKGNNCNVLLTEIQNAITRIYRPILKMCMFYVTTEYRYLREAYALGSGNTSQES